MSEIEISVVMPAFNEGDILTKMLGEIDQIMKAIGSTYEIIVVNDGSTDVTQKIITGAANMNPAFVPVELSRNFGKEAALMAGMTKSRGSCVIFIDSDLQHPPQVITRMVEKWREGFDVVNGRKSFRGSESAMHKASAQLFNWVISRAVGTDMSGASDFKLIDRQVVDALLKCRERHRFFRGLVTWVGFRAIDIEFEVADRPAGSSKWDTAMLIRYSLNNLVEFSSLPLKIVGYLGFGVSILGAILLGQTMYNYLVGDAAIGFTTVIAIQILIGGMSFLSIGALALYISNIYDEQKGRPIFIIRKNKGIMETKRQLKGNERSP